MKFIAKTIITSCILALINATADVQAPPGGRGTNDHANIEVLDKLMAAINELQTNRYQVTVEEYSFFSPYLDIYKEFYPEFASNANFIPVLKKIYLDATIGHVEVSHDIRDQMNTMESMDAQIRAICEEHQVESTDAEVEIDGEKQEWSLYGMLRRMRDDLIQIRKTPMYEHTSQLSKITQKAYDMYRNSEPLTSENFRKWFVYPIKEGIEKIKELYKGYLKNGVLETGGMFTICGIFLQTAVHVLMTVAICMVLGIVSFPTLLAGIAKGAIWATLKAAAGFASVYGITWVPSHFTWALPFLFFRRRSQEGATRGFERTRYVINHFFKAMNKLMFYAVKAMNIFLPFTQQLSLPQPWIVTEAKNSCSREDEAISGSSLWFSDCGTPTHQYSVKCGWFGRSNCCCPKNYKIAIVKGELQQYCIHCTDKEINAEANELVEN